MALQLLGFTNNFIFWIGPDIIVKGHLEMFLSLLMSSLVVLPVVAFKLTFEGLT